MSSFSRATAATRPRRSARRGTGSRRCRPSAPVACTRWRGRCCTATGPGSWTGSRSSRGSFIPKRGWQPRRVDERPRREAPQSREEGCPMSAAPLASARRLLLVLSVLSALTIVAAAIAVFIGSAPISARGVIDALIGRGGDVEDLVVLGLRLPRIAAALLAGGALAVAGVGFQALTRNPLADPSILGVSSGAAFAVVLAQLFGVGTTAVAVLGLTAFAFAGALCAAGAVYLIAASDGRLPLQTLLLAGV